MLCLGSLICPRMGIVCKRREHRSLFSWAVRSLRTRRQNRIKEASLAELTPHKFSSRSTCRLFAVEAHFIEIAMASTSLVRQNYHSDNEAGVNQQINMELNASYVYLVGCWAHAWMDARLMLFCGSSRWRTTLIARTWLCQASTSSSRNSQTRSENTRRSCSSSRIKEEAASS